MQTMNDSMKKTIHCSPMW